jgi:hypothetical protein
MLFDLPCRLAGARLASLLLLAPGTVANCELSTAPGTGELRVRGTIRFVDVEGGCWQFRGRDGTTYELRQAPDSILVDGTEATLVLRRRDDLASICQVGTIVDVERVESVSTLTEDHR